VGVLYTMENGGVMVASALLALALFREKINLQKWIGIIVAAGSTVLLTI
jgi:multidrug transporter EmrE-like cation transporter